jgi:hypothetical protein
MNRFDRWLVFILFIGMGSVAWWVSRMEGWAGFGLLSFFISSIAGIYLFFASDEHLERMQRWMYW